MRTKRLVILVLLVMLFLCVAPSCTVSSDTTVYITTYGEKYHRESCSYLWNSSHPISLNQALTRGYTPCSRCNPPRHSVSESELPQGSSSKSLPMENAQIKPPFSLFRIISAAVVTAFVCVILWKCKLRREAERSKIERLQRIRSLEETYDAKLFDEVFLPPSGFSVDDDGKPILCGEPVLVFCWYGGSVYHKKDCHHAPPVQTPMWEAIGHGARPCKICAPGWYDFSWYFKFKNLKDELAKEGLTIVLEGGTMYLEEKQNTSIP